MNKIKLNNGLEVPALGLGTSGMSQNILIEAVTNSIKLGYSLFDTSPNYNNDISLGEAIKHLKINRSDILIETKVDNYEQINHCVRDFFEQTLKRMNLDYIDIYLMHWPYPNQFLNTWKEMECLYEEKLVRAIGICNFNNHHLIELLKFARILPCINQFELHPLFTQNELVKFNKKNNIQIMSYTPLARMDPKLVNNPLLKQIAYNKNKTVPQIILKWNLQSDYMVIPKSQSLQYLKDNIDIFDFTLTQEEISSILSLNTNYRIRYDPDDMSRY